MTRILVFFLLSSWLVSGQPVERLTLAEARQRAMQSRAQLQVSRLEAAAIGQTPIQLRSPLYPQISANFTGVGASQESRLGAGALNNPVIYSRLGTGFSVNQLLYDFGRTKGLVESAKLRAQSAERQVDATRSSISLTVAQAYYAGLRADALIKVARFTVEARSLVLDQVRAFADAKLKSGLDVSLAEVSLAEAELLLQTAENDRLAAGANLAAAMGESQSQVFELVETIEAASELRPTADLIHQALEQRPDIVAFRTEAQAELQLAKAESRSNWPSISLVGNLGGMPVHSVGIRQSQYAAGGLNIALPVFNGGALKARQTEVQLRGRAATERVREMETQVARDVHIAVLNANTATQRTMLTQRMVEQSSQAVDLARTRYELGLSSIVELSQAQLGNTQAEIQAVNARYDLQLQRTLISFQIGDLQ